MTDSRAERGQRTNYRWPSGMRTENQLPMAERNEDRGPITDGRAEPNDVEFNSRMCSEKTHSHLTSPYGSLAECGTIFSEIRGPD